MNTTVIDGKIFVEKTINGQECYVALKPPMPSSYDKWEGALFEYKNSHSDTIILMCYQIKPGLFIFVHPGGNRYMDKFSEFIHRENLKKFCIDNGLVFTGKYSSDFKIRDQK